MKRSILFSFFLMLFFLSLAFADEPALIPVGKAEAITGEGIYAMNPRWSPGGRKIAFTEPKYAGIWVLNLKTKDYFQVTDEAGAGYGFRWSADGSKILARVSKFENYRRFNAVKIFDLKNSQSYQLTDYRTQMPALPQWAADNNHVYLYTKKKLEIFSANNENQVSATASQISAQRPLIYWNDKNIFALRAGKTETPNLPFEGPFLNVELSPDGQKLAFEKYGGNMFVFDLLTNKLTDLGEGNHPQWSPDGEKIIYMITKDDGYNFTQSDIYAIDAGGSGKVNLTKTSHLIEMNPCWSPDGKKIAFDEMTSGKIFILKVAERPNKKLQKNIR
ncbi:MAG: hypothetical protein GXO74_04815 [Calditrichaeota bacterium]|nr:hypothetical protein [Calditrichota bacterium]